MTAPSRAAAAALALGLLAAAPEAVAQYGGFGQNKIAYEAFTWKVYPSPHFDIYYYGAEEQLLDDVVSYAESAYLRISKELDHELRFRVPLIVYKTHGEFEQTNITLEELSEAVGAFAEPVQNRMVIPIDQPPDRLYAIISHEMTHIFQYSIFFEGYLGRALRASPPLWLMEGMASYLASDEDDLDRMVIRDAVVNNVLPPIQSLDVLSFLTYRYGHAVFDFIEKEYGKEGLRNFIYEYRKVLLTGNIEKAVKEAFGYDIAEFNRRFNRYLRRKYFPVLLEKKGPEDYGKEIGLKKPDVFTFSPTLSPSGELVAALGTPKMELDLVVLSAEDGKQIRNLTKGWSNRYQYLVAEAFSGRRDLSWSPEGDRIAVFARKENGRPLFIYNALSGKVEREIPFKDIAQCASPSFSPDGKMVAFEGNRGGIVDIFEVDLESGEIRNLTQDDFYDANPWYAADGRTILYNRRVGRSWKIFSVDVSSPARKTQLTFGPSDDIQPSLSRDQKTVFFSSNRGTYGVFNIYTLDLATGDLRQYTDVVGGCFDPVEMAPRAGEPYLVFTSFFEGTFRLYRMPLRQPEASITAAEATAAATDVEPFEPPLKLRSDPSKIKPYRLRWDMEAPSISVGVTNDGTFLSNIGLQFADLLGDQRFFVQAYSVAQYANFDLTYVNLRKRLRWGAELFDYRDYYLSAGAYGLDRQQVSRASGAFMFAQYPFNRYYRFETSLGYLDRAQDVLVGLDPLTGLGQFQRFTDTMITTRVGIAGDTTRYQSFGPFQGKRFNMGVTYGFGVGGDGQGNQVLYDLDFRAYKQFTRRALLAWHLAGAINAGQRESYYGFGGINQLRGYDFRAFYGSRVAWSNLEMRFPFVDELRFPVFPIRQIRGFLFFDAGAAWLRNDAWYDPDLLTLRVNSDGTIVPFKAWDSENHRLQDLRASYGAGFQFLFIGGLQFNWAWAWRVPYTQYLPVFSDPVTYSYVKTKSDVHGAQTSFYIVFDW